MPPILGLWMLPLGLLLLAKDVPPLRSTRTRFFDWIERRHPRWLGSAFQWLLRPSSDWTRIPAGILLICGGLLGFPERSRRADAVKSHLLRPGILIDTTRGSIS